MEFGHLELELGGCNKVHAWLPYTVTTIHRSHCIATECFGEVKLMLTDWLGRASHCTSQCQKQLPANFITCHSFLGTAGELVKYSMHMCTMYMYMYVSKLYRHLPAGGGDSP